MLNKEKNRELITRKSVTPAKINRLAEKALKDNFNHTPSRGCIYLKNLSVGSLFQIESGPTRGILISCEHDANVIITKSYKGDDLGKKYISANTSVKEITKV